MSRAALRRGRAAAFLGAGAFLTTVRFVAVVLVVVLLVRGEALAHPGVAIATGLVLGGALGNLADRLFRGSGFLDGAVVDFVDLRWWPVFNVADAAVSCGAILLVLTSARSVSV